MNQINIFKIINTYQTNNYLIFTAINTNTTNFDVLQQEIPNFTDSDAQDIIDNLSINEQERTFIFDLVNNVAYCKVHSS